MAEEFIDFGQFQKKVSPKGIVVIIGIIIILFAAFSSFYMVDQKEEAVVFERTVRLPWFLRVSESLDVEMLKEWPMHVRIRRRAENTSLVYG